MPWYWYIALKQLFPTGKKLSFFSVMSIVGVALGVMVLVVVLSVMTGFQDKLQETLAGNAGDVRIQGSSILYDWQKLDQKLLANPNIEATSPYVEGVMMMQYGNRPAFSGVRGIDPSQEKKVTAVQEYVTQGSIDDLDYQSIIVGSALAEGLGIQIGSMVDLYTPLMLERLKDDEVLLPRELEVVGIFESENSQLNDKLLVNLQLMQELYGVEGGVHGITAKLKPGLDLEKTTFALNKTLPPGIRAMNWLDLNENFLFVLRMEKAMMFFIVIFIILVASFSVTSTLLASVIRKTREIGLIAAMGGRLRHIAQCFCLQGLIIGLAGTALGISGGLIALFFRNDIVHWLAKITQNEHTLGRFYLFTNLPSHTRFSDLALIIIATILIATLAGLLPAIRVMRLKPSEALRNE